MVKVLKNNEIIVTKGDTMILEVELKNDDGTAYVMSGTDKLKMTVRKRPNSAVLLAAESTSNIIDILPEQTKLLEVGHCCYDIELISNGSIETIAGLDSNVLCNMTVVAEITE